MLLRGCVRIPEALAIAGKKGGFLWWHSPAHGLTDTGAGIASTATGSSHSTPPQPQPRRTPAPEECVTNITTVSTLSSPSSLHFQYFSSE